MPTPGKSSPAPGRSEGRIPGQQRQQLKKILEVEHSRGYDNLAVIGGLDRYLQRLLDSGPGEGAGQLLELCPPAFSYATLSKEKRQEWAETMLQHLATPPEAASPPPPQPNRTANLDIPITTLKGVRATMASRFAKLGVRTVRDMLYFFPHRHLDYTQKVPISGLKPGSDQTVVAIIWEAREVRLGSRKGTEAIVGDDTGNIRSIWFNQPYLARRLPTNAQIVLSGRVTEFQGRKQMESPEWELLSPADLTHTGRLVPLYPLTQGLTPRPVRRLVKQVVEEFAPQIPEFLPPEVRHRCTLISLPQAIQQAHYPADESWWNRARRRLAFDELILLQLGVLSSKRDWQKGQQAPPIGRDNQLLEQFRCSLPFALTSAQHRVLEDILADLEKPQPMCRLLQGEVGSGKTVVATAALLLAIANGYQTALMAPTEVLAEQHFNSITALLSATEQGGEMKHLRTCSSPCPQPFNIALLTGSLNPKEKYELQQLTREGKIGLAIGTHALIQKGVEFKRLGLAIVDEQHRFGVAQRSALRQKGFNPHLLVMTATPIPRTLALTLYGDLDLSTIDELPPGRKEITTKWLQPEERESAYAFVRQKMKESRQAFIICPLIEESDTVQAKAATVEYQRLSEEVFPDLRLGLLHGRMSAQDKERVMRDFRAGKLDILVATSVIEVGIDIPNATVMLIEGADRFGLSQLHQFRGRVGRGEHQSYCLLLADNLSPEARERLEIIEKTQNGFVLAEADLRMRGPGEFFGTRQSGLPDLRMARVSDVPLLEMARKEASLLFQEDPKLTRPEHLLLRSELARRWESKGEWS